MTKELEVYDAEAATEAAIVAALARVYGAKIESMTRRATSVHLRIREEYPDRIMETFSVLPNSSRVSWASLSKS